MAENKITETYGYFMKLIESCQYDVSKFITVFFAISER